MIKNRKALIVSTVASTIDQFCMNDIEILQKSYEVHVAANFTEGNNTSLIRLNNFQKELIEKEIKIHKVNFNRRPTNMNNIRAFKEIKDIIKQNHFDIIHCHTPIAAMIVRLAAIGARKSGTKVIYTAHGFHFYKGAPLLNWLIYYPIENILSKKTDALITINLEDYNIAKSFKVKDLIYIPGVGVDTKKHSNLNKIKKEEKLKEIGVPNNAFVVLSVGELNKNKNHEVIIKSLAKLGISNVYYIICGQGDKENYLKSLANSLEVDHRIKFLGYRNDILELYSIADLFVFPSYREGLSLALMEAMSAGLPCIVSEIRGNVDLIESNERKILCNPNNIDEFSTAIKEVYENEDFRQRMININLEKIKKYDLENIKIEVSKVYSEI